MLRRNIPLARSAWTCQSAPTGQAGAPPLAGISRTGNRRSADLQGSVDRARPRHYITLMSSNAVVLLPMMLAVPFLTGCPAPKGEPDDKPAPPPKVVVDEAQLQGVVRTNLDSPNPTDAQRARKEKSERAVRALGLPVNGKLPVIEDDATVKPRANTELAHRTVAVMICAVKGEAADQALTDSLVEEYGAGAWFSPEEDRFRRAPRVSEADRAKFGWRYEALHVFLWALGYTETINPPSQIADAGHDVRALKAAGPNVASSAHPRSTAELLDMADLYYRLHWAAVELRVQGKSNPAVDEEIVMERHRALNWLIRYQNQEWDHVATDT